MEVKGTLPSCKLVMKLPSGPQPEIIEIVEDPFLRLRADSRVGYCSLTLKHVLPRAAQETFHCVSLLVIPLIMRNGAGLKKSGLQGTPSSITNYKHNTGGT